MFIISYYYNTYKSKCFLLILTLIKYKIKYNIFGVYMNKLIISCLFLISTNINADDFLSNYEIIKEEISINQKIENINSETSNYNNIETKSNQNKEKEDYINNPILEFQFKENKSESIIPSEYEDIDVDKLLIETTKDLQNQKILEIIEDKKSKEKELDIIEKLKEMDKRLSDVEKKLAPEEI